MDSRATASPGSTQTGSVESVATFSVGAGASGTVVAVAVQADGKIVLGGSFTSVQGQARNRLARLHADGTLESTASFVVGSGANAIVYGLALDADGKILLGGDFTSINGTARNGCARLANDPATQTLAALDSGRVQWLRGGTAPECDRVAFELSIDAGASWTALGPGYRIAGGWEGIDMSLPATGLLRARGRTAGGLQNGSSGLSNR